MFTRLKIGMKLMLGFGVVVLLLAGVGGAGYWSTRHVAHNSAELKVQEERVKTAERLRSDMLQLRRFEKDVFLNVRDPQKVAEYRKKYQERADRFRERVALLASQAADAEEKSLAASIARNGDAYLAGFFGVLSQVEKGAIADPAAGNAAMGTFKEATHQVEADVSRYVTLVQKLDSRFVQEMERSQRFTSIVLAASIAVAVAVALTLATLISRAITKPVLLLVREADALSNGDLTRQVACRGSDEIGQLATAFQHMSCRLRDAILQIAQTADQVAASSSQLQATADRIAGGTEQVATQATGVAAASEQMSATSGDIAQNCLMAAETSTRASETARYGVTVVRETIVGMERIAGQVKNAAKTVEELGARSDQIGAIVGTIEEIADQTNLLALNAAIEAARAGDQGRGFAVVADEVRALAERTTGATREIGEMIKAIQNETRGAVTAMEEGVGEVERGTVASMRSGEALEQILSQISDVTLQVSQIATAAEEQTAATSEITSNIRHITQVVQFTKNGAADTASASLDLSRESRQLQELMGQFRV